jgi:AcrR family transcriptional regulator
LLFEHFATPTPNVERGFQFLSPSKVSEIAGVSKGLMYHLWAPTEAERDSSFRAFVADVLREVLIEVSDDEFLLTQLESVDLEDDDLGGVIRRIAGAELRSILTGQRRTALLISFALAPYMVGEPLGPAAREASDQLYESLLPFYETALVLLGRSMRSEDGNGRPLSVIDLARALSALTEGFSLEALLYPEITADDQISWDGGTAGVFEIAAEAIVMHMTVKNPSAGAHDE